MKIPNVEEIIRIILWALSGGLVTAGVLDEGQANLIMDPAIIGGVVALVTLAWRLWRGATPNAG